MNVIPHSASTCGLGRTHSLVYRFVSIQCTEGPLAISFSMMVSGRSSMQQRCCPDLPRHHLHRKYQHVGPTTSLPHQHFEQHTTRAQEHDNMPSILELPGELVDNIAYRLGSDDKFSLRLTCRELEQKSQRAFGLHHFTKKCVHLTTDSLTVLLNISKSEKLGKYVRDVTLITALFSAADTARLIVPCKCCFARNPDSHEESSYRFYIEDQLRLRETGEDQALLDEAFRSLPQLNTVALVDSEDRLQPGTDYQGGRKTLRKTGQL